MRTGENETVSHDAARKSVEPLAGLTVFEDCDPWSNEVSRAAVSFAGLLCVRFGAQVLRPEFADDPMKSWSPLLADGSSAAFRFLNRGKTAMPAGWKPDKGMLLSNDPERVSLWHGQSAVLVEAADEDADVWSELTIQAASGLLDIFGEVGRPPLPLPGRLTAYAAGMAAFDALMANYLTLRSGRDVQAARVSVLETAFWVNWKHLLAAEEGRFDAGAGRSEDWQTIPCSDGHIALTFQDKDVRKLAAMTDDPRLLAPEFENRILRGRNIEAFLRIIRDWMRSRSRVEIVGRAKDLGIPVGPVLGMGELPADRQFIDRDFIERSADGRRSPRLPLLWNGVRPAASEGSESAGEGYA